MSLLLFVALVIASWRLTRLLTKDEFPPVRWLREWMIRTMADTAADGSLTPGRRFGAPGYAVAYVWTCYWCMSFWAGLVVWGLADWRLSVPFPWLMVACGSALSGVMGWVEEEHDQRYALKQRDLDGRRR